MPKIEHMVMGLWLFTALIESGSLFLKVGHGWLVLLCVEGTTQELLHSHGWPVLPGAEKPRTNEKGPHWAGLFACLCGVACSYARARQRLALLFARLLLLTAGTTPRAAGALAFGKWAVVEIMRRLNQMLRRNASDDFA